MKSKSEQATDHFNSGRNCAQAVAYAFKDDVAIDGNTILRIATGFGGGVARTGNLCGAVSGAVMILGLRHGDDENNGGNKEKCHKIAQDFMERFEAQRGSLQCKSLLGGIDLRTPGGHDEMKRLDARNKICAPCVSCAAEILESMLH